MFFPIASPWPALVPPPFPHPETTPINEDAQALARVMLEAGREPIWILLNVSAYYGEQGRQAALAVIEEEGEQTSGLGR
jgi:hypothetical protein